MIFIPLVIAAAMFTTDPGTGQIIQTETGIEQATDDLFQSEREEEVLDGLSDPDFDLSDNEGDLLEDSPDLPEDQALDSSGSASDISDASGSDVQIVELLEEQIALLAETSASVAGTMNSQVLDLMDRIVNGLPSGYKYAAFRTSVNDSYAASLYIGNKVDVSGDTILFGGDCIRVDFLRTSGSGSNYIYYYQSNASNSVIDYHDRSILYTNCLDYHPTLGDSQERGLTFGQLLAALFFLAVVYYVLNRRTAS